MDELSAVLGSSHRSERHDVKSIPIAVQLFGEKYGDETVRQIFLDHLLLDSQENGGNPHIPNEVRWSWDIRILVFGLGSISLIFGYIINLSMGNPVGLWLSQNWLAGTGIVVCIIVAVLIIYATGIGFKEINSYGFVFWLGLVVGISNLGIFFFFVSDSGYNGYIVRQNWYIFVGWSIVCFVVALLLKEYRRK
jgi:hypothetical protein